MSYDWFGIVADRLSHPVALLAQAGQICACNAACRRVLGDQLKGESLLTCVRDPDAVRRFLALASRSGSPLPGTITFVHADKRWRCSASAVRTRGRVFVIMELSGDHEASARFLLLNQQIDRLHAEMSRRTALERERDHLLELERKARDRAEIDSRLKDEFLASVSHELRTPLHAIAGWVDLLQKNPDNEGLRERGLEVIARNTQAQVQLTEDLVDVSLIISGRMRLELQPVDLEEVIRHAAESARPAAVAKNIRLEVIASVGSCVVNGDPDRLLQIVWNLLANATRFTPKGGKIQVLLQRVESHAEIVVSDTGEGIETDVLPFVFDRFRRADASSTRRHGGLGLGLAIVRHLVELHGGSVSAESAGLGQGASFSVVLPLPIFESRTGKVGAERLQGTCDRNLEGVHILLVEDNDDSRELLGRLLEAEGARVDAAATASEAHEIFANERPSVVVSDIEMPGEDGFAMMRKLRALESESGRDPVVAIAVSAHSIGEARLRSLRAGYQGFLAKPLKTDELIALIGSLKNTSTRSG